MLVQVWGVNFNNKGAELMLNAVVQQVSQFSRDAAVAAELDVGNVQQRSNAGLKSLGWREFTRVPFAGPAVGAVSGLLPKALRQSLKIVLRSEVQAILDASGFAYTDQWGPGPAELMAKRTNEWKRNGKKIVLLPQAFGPFTTPAIQKAFRQVLDNADLVFARDAESYQHLMSLGGRADHIKQAPDFTNLLAGKVPAYFDGAKPKACIVPNYRMIDKTGSETSDHYLPFLAACAKHLIAKGIEPFILVHDDTKKDRQLASRLQEAIGQDVPVLYELDPLHIKGILGQSHLVISSRFHGLVSALSQGVPCLATGWSHKYQKLFEDYGCSEFLIKDFTQLDHAFDLIQQALAEPSRSDVIARIERAGTMQKEKSKAMWEEVFATINS